jgi:hypothetical protein
MDSPGTMLDLVLNTTYHLPSLWAAKLQDGSELRVAINWTDETAVVTVDAPKKSAVELWSGDKASIKDGTISVELPPRAARLFHFR